MTPITALGSRYGIQGALGRSVKRASTAWSPTDISGCLCWLDFSDADTMFTDAGTTKVSTDGDLVYQINDKSGNSKNAVQTTEAKRYAYKVNIKNSLSVLSSNDVQGGYSLTGLTSTSGSYTFFFVFDRLSTANWMFDTQTGRFVLATSNSGNYSWNDPGGWHNIASTTTGWQSLTYHFTSGGNGVIYKNGSSLGSAAYTTRNIGGRVGLFSDYTVIGTKSGNHSEIIIYDSALSDTNRQTVETYLNNKWAIYS